GHLLAHGRPERIGARRDVPRSEAEVILAGRFGHVGKARAGRSEAKPSAATVLLGIGAAAGRGKTAVAGPASMRRSASVRPCGHAILFGRAADSNPPAEAWQIPAELARA